MKVQMKNPLYDDLPSPDEKKEAKEIDLSGLEGVLESYGSSLKIDEFHLGYHLESIDQILTPEKINAFLQTTKIFENDKNYQSYTGKFISKLIQNSYNAGNNNFKLNTKNLKEIHSLGYGLQGIKEKQIKITIEGNTGNWCGEESKHTTFNIKGNTGNWCGWRSKHTTFNIEGNTRNYCGGYSYNSTFNIKENTGDSCGHFSNNTTYNIKGNTGNKCGEFSNNTTYITHKPELYQKLLKQLPTTNKAILKDKNDKIIEEKTV